jgi:hypothetical protein
MDISYFQVFRPFIYAAVITWAMKAKKRIESKSDRKRGRFRKNLHYSKYSLPLRYAAKILNLDYSTISRYKTIAEEYGFLKVQKQYERILLHPSHLDDLRKYNEEGYRYVIINKIIHIQNPDIIQSTIHLTYKRRKRPRAP